MKDFLKAIVYGGVFAVPFIVLIVVNDLFFPFITGKNFAFRIVVEILFAAWILLAFLDPKYRPRWSWLLGGFGFLLIVMFFANLFGVHPPTSFWSNYERMEGYVTLVHLFMYFVVLGHFLQTAQQWTWFWYTSLTAATLVALNGLAEYADPDSGGRVAGMLGNASYLAIYMLFHIFLTFYLFVRSKNLYMQLLLVGLFVLFAFVLLQTGTRGTAIGLVTGMATMVVYVAIFAASNPQFRRYAIAATALFVVLIGSFFAFRDHAVVQESSTLSRIANIDLQADLEVRGTIWGMAWSGVEERPVLGWGQGNFNYVFNQEYDPFLYDQEEWFDRVHNIFLDWLIAGGVLGFIGYFGTLAAAVYYLARRQRFVPEEQRFSVLEQSVLLGLLVAYLTHNIVVFDNIISYIFYASVLAMIHARVSTPIPAVQYATIKKTTVRDIAMPAVIVILGTTIYFVNVPSMQAASDIIDAMRTQTVDGRLEVFERAFDRGSFANQEIAEQFAQQAISIAGAEGVAQADRERFMARAEQALVTAANEKPGDARIHVFLGSFYRSIGDASSAREHFDLARELSPRKPSIIIQQGATELALGDAEAALERFETAYELDTRNEQALVFYAGTLFQVDRGDEAVALLRDTSASTTLTTTAPAGPLPTEVETPGSDGTATTTSVTVPSRVRTFAQEEYAINAVNQSGNNEFLAELYEIRVLERVSDPQEWTSLSFVYFDQDDTDQAVSTLRRAGQAIPDFAERAECFAANIEQGNEPQDGC